MDLELSRWKSVEIAASFSPSSCWSSSTSCVTPPSGCRFRSSKAHLKRESSHIQITVTVEVFGHYHCFIFLFVFFPLLFVCWMWIFNLWIDLFSYIFYLETVLNVENYWRFWFEKEKKKLKIDWSEFNCVNDFKPEAILIMMLNWGWKLGMGYACWWKYLLCDIMCVYILIHCAS